MIIYKALEPLREWLERDGYLITRVELTANYDVLRDSAGNYRAPFQPGAERLTVTVVGPPGSAEPPKLPARVIPGWIVRHAWELGSRVDPGTSGRRYYCGWIVRNAWELASRVDLDTGGRRYYWRASGYLTSRAGICSPGT